MADAYNLLIDVGNTFVKWGRYKMQPAAPHGMAAPAKGWAHDNCIEYGNTLLDEIPSLVGTFRRSPAPRHTVVSNVAGTKTRNTLMHVLEIWPDARPMAQELSNSPLGAAAGAGVIAGAGVSD